MDPTKTPITNVHNRQKPRPRSINKTTVSTVALATAKATADLSSGTWSSNSNAAGMKEAPISISIVPATKGVMMRPQQRKVRRHQEIYGRGEDY